MKTLSYPYTVHITKEPEHATSIVHNLTSKGEKQTIIACGGDGTLSEVINGIDNFELTTIAVLPIGSGNDLAKITAIKNMGVIDALKWILTNKPRKINYFYVNEYRCINIFGFGLDTDILKAHYRHSWLPRRLSYKLATIFCSLFWKSHKCKIQIDNGPVQEMDNILTVVGNGQTIGGGLKVCPLAKIDDDYLDFTSIKKFNRIHTISWLTKCLKGKIYSIPAVTSRRCRKVVIELPNKTYEYDGNIVSGQNKITIVIGKEKINFIG